MHEAGRELPRNKLEVVGLVANDAAEANDRIVAALLGKRERGYGHGEDVRYPEDIRVFNPVLAQRPKSAAQQPAAHLLLLARDDDCEVKIGTAQVWRGAVLRHYESSLRHDDVPGMEVSGIRARSTHT